jgi:hypothetical protein
MQKLPVALIRGHETDDLAGQSSTSGGSVDSDEND